MNYRTRVRKYNGRWRLEYYLPYSGELCVDYTTWEKAMREACSIEKYRDFA